MANTIHLSGEYTREEQLAGGTITPGHLIESYNASGVEKFRVHSTAKGWAERLFAQEDALQGNTIDDNYSSGDLVTANLCENGAKVQAWLYPGTAYVIGDKLISKGDGTLYKITGSSDLDVVGVLLENVDLSASGAVATRADIRIK